ncbi:hypothetical protein DNTS_014125 [Danionella cerebrum]|nr:hypothetical protein DNTS_014125 [Danionella translucida]
MPTKFLRQPHWLQLSRGCTLHWTAGLKVNRAENRCKRQMTGREEFVGLLLGIPGTISFALLPNMLENGDRG